MNSKCFILMQTPLQLDIWLQSYEEFVNAKNKVKQRNWNTVFANISKPISPTSDSFLLDHVINVSQVKFILAIPLFLPPFCYDRMNAICVTTLHTAGMTRQQVQNFTNSLITLLYLNHNEYKHGMPRICF